MKRGNLFLNNRLLLHKSGKKALHLVVAGLSVLTLAGAVNASQIGDSSAHAKVRKNAYDISQWQGYISSHQAKKLKHEVGFVILRTQYGTANDIRFSHNVSMMKKYHIPYGVYSYSMYHNANQARREARSLHRKAPQARFYVNDCEVNKSGGRLNSATRAWSKEMHHVSNRPAILYTYLGFMPKLTQHTRHAYNGIWLAAYTSRRPITPYKYDLWQFSDNHYSRALKEKLDDSKVTNQKDLSMWIGNNSHNHKRANKSRVEKPISPHSPYSATNANSADVMNNKPAHKHQVRKQNNHKHQQKHVNINKNQKHHSNNTQKVNHHVNFNNKHNDHNNHLPSSGIIDQTENHVTF